MSKDYVKIFKELDPTEELFILHGNYILVNVLDDEEIKTASGIVIATQQNQRFGGANSERPVFAEVLAVGEGFADDEGNSVPVGSEPGDVIVVGQNAIQQFSRFGTVPAASGLKVGLVRESEIIMQFPSLEAYRTYFNNLEKAMRGDQS
jgi:co-chaperonin GroES (HSP10)